MKKEQEKTAQALKLSIQMEIDGKAFYLKASKASSNEAGRTLLQTLAAEEEIHRRRFEAIFQEISQKNQWPAGEYGPDSSRRLRDTLDRSVRTMGRDIKFGSSELADVQTAMALENKTYDFYTNHAADASFDTEREFYESLAAQEREHYLLLLDYSEYLRDPAAWFTEHEHPTLDGG
jgi:rubrerythrin